MSEKLLWYFESVDLYEILCPTKLGMEESRNNNTFKKSDFIYFPEDIANNIYMIAQGRVKIGTYFDDGKEVIKAILTKGEIFGELALTGEDKRSDFAQSMDNETILCPMTVDDMKNLMVNNQELTFKVFKLIGHKVKRLERKITSLVFKDARERIIEFLHDAAAWKGQKVGFETMIQTKLTHKDIAQLTGTSRQTVTTILNDLKDKNIIYFDRRKILIRDLELLK